MSGIFKQPIIIALLLAATAQAQAQVSSGAQPIQRKPVQLQQLSAHQSVSYYKTLIQTNARPKAATLSMQGSVADGQRMQRLRGNVATARQEVLKHVTLTTANNVNSNRIPAQAQTPVSYGENVKRINAMLAELTKNARKEAAENKLQLMQQKVNPPVQNPNQTTTPVQVQQQAPIATQPNQAPVQIVPQPVRKGRVVTPAGRQ